ASEPALRQSDGEKKGPAFRCGPIPTDANNSVEACVWSNQVTTRDQRTFTVYNVSAHASYRDADGQWKPAKGFRSSQIPTVIYCLQTCFNWVCYQRDPN